MHKILSCILVSVFLFCFSIQRTSAQNLQNISTVNVDDISDAQLTQMLRQAQDAGLSDTQVLQKAAAQGMPENQVRKLQDRISNLRHNGSTTVDTGRYTNQQRLYISADSDTTNNKVLYRHKGPNIFGADLFRNNHIRFEPNLRIATPVNYIIGPDDQLNISVYGKSLVNWRLTVSPDGDINIPGVGILNVAGKSIGQATASITARLRASNYAIGNGTSVQITLGNIRSIKVIMVGQLVRPGTYTLPSLATAFNALYAAGGPNNNGSFRQIEIIRNNRIIRHLDVYDFLTKGDQSNNIVLQDQDIIRVPTYRVRVDMEGQVKVPGLFEVLPGETLQSVLNFAGGFTDSAYTARIVVSQISDQQRRITDVPESDYKNYIPLRGDKYIVSSIINRYENRVIINGAVFKPGEYELENGLTLSQLIIKAAGLKEDAFPDRGILTRLQPDNTTKIIAFNVKDVVKGINDIPLQREDSVYISSIFELRDRYTVAINGEVRIPGTFAYSDSMKVADLIIKAGGLAEGASTKRIEVARRIYNADEKSKAAHIANVFSVNINGDLKPGDADFNLQPFDVVSVYGLPGFEKQRTVKVEGEVLYPGDYTIKEKDEKISDLVKRAGGFTAFADVDGASLKRDNISLLGLEKNKVDINAVTQEQNARYNRLRKTYRDSTDTISQQIRNNYIGINLPKIMQAPGSSADLILEDGDVLRVPKQQQVVRVDGQVLYPSAVVYSNGKSFKGYVYNAGGFGPEALKRGAYVVYPNGSVRGTRKFLFFNSYPPVKPGSQIYVPKRSLRRGLSPTEVVGITSGVASIAAIILGIISLHK
jgi:protein involved in polysaccharide export with SLBB domain